VCVYVGEGVWGGGVCVWGVLGVYVCVRVMCVCTIAERHDVPILFEHTRRGFYRCRRVTLYIE